MEQQIAGAVGTKKERNLGIELLRLVSMLMIVIHHCLGHGGFRAAADGITESLAWLLTAACFGAVNLYALTTGYVCVKATHRWQRIVELWMSVLFYSLLFSAIDFISSGTVNLHSLVEAFLPMTMRRYWYFSSYFLLFFMIPLLNKLADGLKKCSYRRFLVIVGLLLCTAGWFSDYIGSGAFGTMSGYSTIWLAYLYLVGAYIRRFESDFRLSKPSYIYIYIYIYIGAVCLTWGSKYLIQFFTTLILGKSILQEFFYSYMSPIILLGAIALLLCFSQISVRHGKKLLLTVAPCSFGVYLIHEHPYIRQLFIKGRFAPLAQRPWYEAIGILLGAAVVIFVVCLAIEYLRRQLFRLLRVSNFCKAVTERIGRLLRRLEMRTEIKRKKESKTP